MKSPLGHSDHCVIKLKFKCYYKIEEDSTQRWNYFKGDYQQMNNELDIQWDEILHGLSPDEMTKKFLEIYETAKKNAFPW